MPLVIDLNRISAEDFILIVQVFRETANMPSNFPGDAIFSDRKTTAGIVTKGDGYVEDPAAWHNFVCYNDDKLDELVTWILSAIMHLDDEQILRCLDELRLDLEINTLEFQAHVLGDHAT